MGWFSNNSSQKKLNWTELSTVEEFSAFLVQEDKPIVVFKHSTRCAISAMALKSLESEWDTPESEVHLGFIDLIQHRDVSNACAEHTKVMHQSPQLIVIKAGEVVYNASHGAINYKNIEKFF